jgi:hemoglobin/transferrin/lactoferrin receptor protein
MRKKQIRICETARQWFVAAGVVAAVSAQAEEAKLPPTLEPVVVTATLAEAALVDVPYSAAHVSDERILELQAASFPEALVQQPGIMLQQTGRGMGSPFIRGFTGFRNLALIDGVRLNNSVFRDGPNQYWSLIDALSVSGIDVVKGQGSVLFGSDAVGGVVNALTKGPVYKDGPGVHTTGMVATRYATAERSWTGRIEGSVSEAGRYGLHVGLTGRTFGDLQAAGQGRLPNTGYDELGVDLKMEVFLEPETKLVLAHNQYHQDDVWRTHRTIYAVPFAGSDVGDELAHVFDQDRYLSYVRLESDRDHGWLQHYDVTLSHQRMSEERVRRRSRGRTDQEGFDVDAWGIAANFRSESPLGTLSYGASYYLDDVSAFRVSRSGGATTVAGQGPVADDSRYHLLGVYLQDEIRIGESLDLILGGRYTYAAAEAGRIEDPQTDRLYSQSDSWQDLSGSARLQWSVDEAKRLRFFGGVSQAFRAPNLSDMSRFDVARSNEVEVPAAALDPEEFVNWEAGVRWVGEKVSASVAYFYTDIQDLIVRAPTGNLRDEQVEVTRRNGGSGYVQGIESSLSLKLGKDWTVFGNMTWQEGEVESFPTESQRKVSEPFSRLMPLTGLAGVRWDSPGRRWWVEGTLQIVDDATRLSSGDVRDTQRIPPGGTPGFTVATLRSGWQVTDALLLTAAVENFTDEAYRIHGSGVNQPGVNFVFGAQMRF